MVVLRVRPEVGIVRQCKSARADGSVGAFFLGPGLNALTLDAILTVVVIDDDVFTDVFGSTVWFNDEGPCRRRPVHSGRSASHVGDRADDAIGRSLSRAGLVAS